MAVILILLQRVFSTPHGKYIMPVTGERIQPQFYGYDIVIVSCETLRPYLVKTFFSPGALPDICPVDVFFANLSMWPLVARL